MAISLPTLALAAYWIAGRPNNEVLPSRWETTRVAWNGTYLDFSPRQEENEFFLPFDFIKEKLDPAIRWEGESLGATEAERTEPVSIDAEKNRVIITTADRVLDLRTEGLSAYINSRPLDLNLPPLLIDGQPHLPVSLLTEIYPLQVDFKSETNTLILDKTDTPQQTARVQTAKTALRLGPTIREAIIARLDQEALLLVYSEEDGWYRAQTEEGLVGWVRESEVELAGIKVIAEPQPPQSRAWKPLGQKVSLMWEHVVRTTPDMNRVGSMSGINVVSPTWFSLADGEGNLVNRADSRYVAWAQANGYQVWALVDNNFDQELTTRVLRDPEKRRRIIDQLLVYSELYQLNGINLDFENISRADRDLYSQFVREAAPYLREQGLTLSVDVTVPSGGEWSVGYDRRALAQAADYVILMAYDEHWSTSPRAGSVASLPWVERGVRQTLQEVPRNKLILGLPLYTRLWEEKQEEGARVRVESKALGMQQIARVLAENGVKIIPDQSSGQNYGEFRTGSSRFRVWLEDESSLSARLELARREDLSGIAFWRRGFEAPEIWEAIAPTLEQMR